MGQGLAGTAIAWALRWAGFRVLVIDREDACTSSRVAAGLVTPITGGRLATTWRLAELWPAAEAFYRRAEAETGAAFFHTRPSVRLFRDDAERQQFVAKADTAFRGLVGGPDPPVNADWFAAPFGGFAMTPAGRLDVPTYLDASRDHFRRDGAYFAVDLDPVRDVEPAADGVRLPRLGVTASAIVFCQGFAGQGNPWFPAVRFNPTRGDVLTVRVPGLAEERVVHRGVWLLPLGDGLFRAGSTYHRGDLDPTPTARGRDEITDQLRQFLRLPFAVVGHQAAVRPIIRAGRPLLGLHPDHPRVGFFNGLGSKGALLAPFFATQLARHLAGQGAIDPDSDLRRL